MARFLFQRNNVTILLFHELPLANAKDIIEYLNKTYTLISLEEYISYRVNGKHEQLPKYPMVITFDDGRKSNLTLVDFFLQQGNTPTIYVCSDRQKQDGFPLFDDMDFIQANKHFDLQAHTKTHPDLRESSNEIAKVEISECKGRLEKRLNKEITSFAYPYGSYGDREVKLVEEAGYSNAVSVDFGFNNDQTNIYKLKRICISNSPTVHETAIKASGIWGLIRRRRRKTLKY